MPNLRQQLEESIRGDFCLMGLGNVDYGDDGFGVRLAEDLLAHGMTNVVIAGTNPEQWIGRLADQGFPHVVFLDAVECGVLPGAVIFLSSTEVVSRFPQISTHKISLSTLAMWAETRGGTRAWLLGVQPESVKPGSHLTLSVQRTLEGLREVLLSLWVHSAKPTPETVLEVIA